MKVLSVTWNIYDPRIEQFKNVCTGGGLVIKNLCEYIGEREESFLFLGQCELPEIKLDNTTICATECLVEWDEDESKAQHMLRVFVKVVDKLKPDFVNVHGIGELSILVLKYCIAQGIPCVYTDHLYISPNNLITGYERSVEWEKELYSIPGLRVIAVSNGQRKRIISDGMIDKDRIVAIPNGTDFVPEIRNANLSEKYSLYGFKTLICSGTLLDRKNQLQIVRAMKYLPDEVKVKVLFCGRDGMKGRLQEAIAENDLSDKLIYVGALSSDEMKEYYSVADGLIMPSYAEGLSIAALEMISYGKPVIMFADSECADDLSDKRVVQFAEDRSDEQLTKAIVNWYESDWDEEYIKDYSKHYSMERMAADYLMYYQTHKM